MKWISVEKRLPKLKHKKGNPHSDKVLVSDGAHIQVGIRWVAGNTEYFLPDFREDFDDITHWMPLPPLPDKCNCANCDEETRQILDEIYWKQPEN